MAATSTVVCLLAVFVGASLVDCAAPAPGKKSDRPSLKEYNDANAKKAAEADAVAARDKKGAAVRKVTDMMESLQQQVVEEGEKEAKTYDKFACFCKDMTNEKTAAIKKGKDSKSELQANIEKLNKQRDDLDAKITGLNKDIEEQENKQAQLKSTREEDLGVYEKNAADLSAAISGVREATKVLKSSNTASLVQLQSVSSTVKTALMMADALGLKSAQSPGAIFLQGAPSVEMEDYKFHSSSIIETLEKLTADFEAEKNKVDAEEVKSVQEFTMKMQESTDTVKALTKDLNDSKERKDQTVEDIAENTQEFTTVSATLLDDQEYLAELSKGCSEKAKTWDQRSKVRVQELTAITEAMDIIKATVTEKTLASTIRFAQTGSTLHMADAVVNNEDALEAIEAEAEGSESEAPVAFLQRRSQSSSLLSIFARKHMAATHSPDSDVARQMVSSLLKSKGMQLKSTLLLSLATQVGADPFAKVKKLIQELIERLLSEAANEANQKGWCDKALADAAQKRDNAADKAAELNGRMAKLEATRNKLAEELKVLSDEIGELTKAQAEAQKNRKEEKEENKETVHEAEQGLEATARAIEILARFYGTAAKATVDLSLSQASPFEDAPDAGFKTGEAYTAVGSDSGGIVGMLEVIKSDFQRTISETQASEKSAAKAHLEFMTESSKSLAEKNMATDQKTKYKTEAEANLDEADTSLATQTDILVTSVEELRKLQPTCIDTGMSYAERVALREQEIASLKKALCIFGNFAQYGPDGAADAC